MNSKLNIDFNHNRFLMFVIDDMANQMEYDEGKQVIRLTLGKSELPLHQDIIEEMQDALGDFKKSALVYPSGLPALKEELSLYYEKEFNVKIPPKNFIIGPGTSTLFRNLFALLTDKQDDVLLPHPYYSLYRFSAMLTGANINYYSIDPKSRKLDIESFKKNFTKNTKIVVINTPGNPLGNVLTDEELYAVDEIVDGQAVIINDEIYANVYFDQQNKSVMNLKNTKSIFITTNAFSKAYRMYSRRVGYCIVPDDYIEPMTVILHHTQLTVDPVVQFGAIEALHKPDEVKKLVASYKKRRDYTVKKLAGIPGITPIYSEGGFYFTIDCEEFMKEHHYESSLELASRILNEKQVATVPGSDFGLPYTIRLSFSSSLYEEGIDRLAVFLVRERKMMQNDIYEVINKTDKKYPGIALSSLILQECKLYENRTAIIDYERKISYRELGSRIRNIQAELMSRGVKAGSPVIVVGDRCCEIIIMAVAIMQSGGIYVPVDTSYPVSRMEYIITHTKPEIIIDLTGNHIDRNISCEGVPCSTYEELTVYPKKEESQNVTEPDLNLTSYVMYTSGTTGYPKGVEITHKAIGNTLFWLSDKFLLDKEDVVAFKTSIGFTDSIWEMFWPLINGATVTIINSQDARNISYLYHWLEKEEVSYTQFVPSMLKVFLEYIAKEKIRNPLPKLRWIFNGGEQIGIDLVQQFNSIFQRARIADIYGMTESAVYATYYLVEKQVRKDWTKIPIGLPIANTKVYLLRQNGQYCKVNEKGEICLSGIGIAKGYYRDLAETEKQFTQDKEGRRLYHTGDLGFLDESGCLWYAGRMDHQVKVRGNRVEIYEIEQVLHNYSGIGQFAIVPVENSYQETLLVYFSDNAKISETNVRAYLREKLPEYMIPQRYFFLEEIPLTVNRKIDRTRLKEIYTDLGKQEKHQSKEQDGIVRVWQEVLERDDFGEDNDFYELGGDSIGMARVQIELEKQGYHVTYEQLLKNRTLKDINQLIKKEKN